MYRKVPPAIPCKIPLQISCDRLGGIPHIPMPIPIPMGLERLKTTFDKMKFLRLRSDWAMLRPRLKAITALCDMTAMKIERRLPSSSCNPIAIPVAAGKVSGITGVASPQTPGSSSPGSGELPAPASVSGKIHNTSQIVTKDTQCQNCRCP